MSANSRVIQSNQFAVHPRLGEIVLRHLDAPYLREPSEVGRRAFASVGERLVQSPFILDAGCGTGASTLALARRHADALVLGVDKSAARLAVGQRLIARGDAPENVLLLHCELVDFWQLAAAAGLRCKRQYLLYPNPWPKAEQLRRRWHAHPVFPTMRKLGGGIELRTNWKIYAEEFALALDVAGIEPALDAFTPGEALTPFERKYAASGHGLWRCVGRDSKIATRDA